MDISLSSWFVIMLAAVAANMPFLNERMFAIIPLARQQKSVPMRLLELLVLYFLILGIAYLMEARIGNVFPQKWEFYAVTVCLFIVAAFPGFVFRYLRKHHG